MAGKFLTPQTGKIAVYAVALTLLAFYGFKCAAGNDFSAFYDAGSFALAGKNVYQPSPSTGMYVFYLPYFALLMMPFAALPFWLAAWIWFLLKAFCYRTLFLAHKAGFSGEKYGWVWALVPFVILINPINVEFKLGQVNLFVHFLLLACLWLAWRNRLWLSAACCAVACVKLTPLIFLPYFALKKEWRLLGRIAAVMAFFGIIFIARFGPRRTIAMARDWRQITAAHKLSREAMATIGNQSLAGCLARFLPPLSERNFKTAVNVVCLVLAALSFFAIWKGSASPEAGAALVFVLMLLISPDTRTAHMVHLLAPLMLLSRIRDKISLSALALVFVLFALPGKDVLGAALHDKMRYYSFQTFGLFAVWLVFLAKQRVRA